MQETEKQTGQIPVRRSALSFLRAGTLPGAGIIAMGSKKQASASS